MQKKTVVFLFAYWHDPRWRGFVGASVKIRDLAVNLGKAGCDAVLFVPRCGVESNDAPFELAEVPVVQMPLLRPLSYNLFALADLLFRRGTQSPDVVYLRRTTAISPLMYAKIKGAKFFYEVNDDPYWEFGDENVDMLPRLRQLLYRKLDELNLRNADRIFVISVKVLEKILERNPKISRSRLVLMPSGANTDLFAPVPRKKAFEITGLDSGNKYVGFVGSLLDHQGIDVLIEAAEMVRRNKPDCRFLIVGEGPMKSVWEKEVRRLKLEREFVFTGQIPYQELPAWIGAMDVCLAPYVRNAGYRSPVKMFDYLSCGRPVIASRIEGTTDIFEAVEAVTLIAPEDPEALGGAILESLGHSVVSDDAGRQGRRWVKDNFDRSKNAALVIDEALSLFRGRR